MDRIIAQAPWSAVIPKFAKDGTVQFFSVSDHHWGTTLSLHNISHIPDQVIITPLLLDRLFSKHRFLNTSRMISPLVGFRKQAKNELGAMRYTGFDIDSWNFPDPFKPALAHYPDGSPWWAAKWYDISSVRLTTGCWVLEKNTRLKCGSWPHELLSLPR